MTFIVPFQEEFCQKIQTVYYVNEDEQGTHGSSLMTSEKCPNCEERHIYKVFEAKSTKEMDDYVVETYDCKCPSCRKTFDLKREFDI